MITPAPPPARAYSTPRPHRWPAGLLLAGLWLLLSLWWPIGAGAEAPIVLEAEANIERFPNVVLQLAVVDQRRQPVAGLTSDQVSLLEGNQQLQPTSVAMLRDSPTPLSLLFALDTSQSMADGRLAPATESIKAILSRLRPTDNAAIVRFGGPPGLSQPFTRDRVVLSQALDRLTAEGNRRLYDGTYLAVAEAARMSGNRAVILITSGEDSQSQILLGPVKDMVTDARMKLYIIGLGNAVRDEALESLAKGSGGRYYKAPRPGDLTTVVRAAYEDFSSRYEIAYTSELREFQPNERVITQVTLATAGGAVTSAIAYRAPRFASSAPVAPDRRVPALQPVVTAPPRPPLDDRFILLCGALTGLGVLATALGLLLSQERAARDRRLSGFVSTSGYHRGDRAPSLWQLLVALLVRAVAALLIRFLPPQQVRRISHRLILAGSPYGWRVSNFIAFKGATTLLGLFIGWLLPPSSLFTSVLFPIVFALLGFLLPDLWLSAKIQARQRQILRALPSALDLLAISVEAGLSLDAAMLEVVHKWRNPLGDEFATILADLKVGKTRREALRGFVSRTNLAEVNTFVSSLIQADEIGLSIGRTLVIQAEQMRLRQRQRAERLAREASVKMLFPMAVLILPAIFVVILVPALPTIIESLRSVGGN